MKTTYLHPQNMSRAVRTGKPQNWRKATVPDFKIPEVTLPESNKRCSAYAYPGLIRLRCEQPVQELIDPKQIVEIVVAFYRMKPDDLKANNRRKHIVKARQVAWYFIRKFRNDITLRRCGQMFGMFDHTTVIHNIEAIRRRGKTEPQIEFELTSIEASIKALNNMP